MRFVRGERVIHAGMTPDINRQNKVERSFRERELVNVRPAEPRARVLAGGEFHGVLAFIDAGQFGQWKFFSHRPKHSSSATARV